MKEVALFLIGIMLLSYPVPDIKNENAVSAKIVYFGDDFEKVINNEVDVKKLVDALSSLELINSEDMNIDQRSGALAISLYDKDNKEVDYYFIGEYIYNRKDNNEGKYYKSINIENIQIVCDIICGDPFKRLHIKTENYEGAIISIKDSKWYPNRQKIAEFEENFGEYINNLEENYENTYIKKFLKYYKRQYIGIVIDGEKVIFCNLILMSHKPNWTKEYVFVFDGGANFFNIKYNVKTKEFFDFDINGEA